MDAKLYIRVVYIGLYYSFLLESHAMSFGKTSSDNQNANTTDTTSLRRAFHLKRLFPDLISMGNR